VGRVNWLARGEQSAHLKGQGVICDSLRAPIDLVGCRIWTAENRPRYNRDKLRHPSDLTDEERAHIEPLIPPAKPGGGKRRVNIREVADGVMYVLSTGCQWRYLRKDLSPISTVHDYLSLWLNSHTKCDIGCVRDRHGNKRHAPRP
jgi:transposase